METSNIANLDDGDFLLAVWEICNVISKQYDITFSYEFLNILSNWISSAVCHISKKLEYFAKHGKRSVITIEDMKLYFSNLSEIIDDFKDKNYDSDTVNLDSSSANSIDISKNKNYDCDTLTLSSNSASSTIVFSTENRKHKSPTTLSESPIDSKKTYVAREVEKNNSNYNLRQKKTIRHVFYAE